MTLLLAAVGATVAALFELTVRRTFGSGTPCRTWCSSSASSSRSRSDSKRGSSGPSSAGSHLMSWRSGRSDRPPSRSCSAWAARRSSATSSLGSGPWPRSSPRSSSACLYSMVLFVLIGALRSPLPVSDPIERHPARRRSTTPCSPRSSGPSLISIHDHRVADRAGRLVNAYLDGRPDAGAAPVALPRLRGRRGPRDHDADRPAVLPPDRQRRRVQGALDRTTDGRRVDRRRRAASSTTARAARSSRTCRRSRSRSGRPTCPVQFRQEVVDRLAVDDRHGPGRDQHDHRQQPGLGVRPRPDRRRRRRGDRPPDLRVVDAAPGRRGRRRGPPRVPRRAADVADPRLHRPGLRRTAPGPQAPRATCPTT